MGFSLFGSSGDKKTEQNTTNVTNDTTTTNSHNVTSNAANTLNAALTNNQSFIKNDSLTQNTALQLTDSFNRLQTYNLANVGNTTIGANPPVMDYAKFFDNAPQSKNGETDVSKLQPLLDFNSLSKTNAETLAALDKLSRGVQTGFVDNVSATGNSAAALNPVANTINANQNIILYVLIGLVVFMLFRNK